MVYILKDVVAPSFSASSLATVDCYTSSVADIRGLTNITVSSSPPPGKTRNDRDELLGIDLTKIRTQILGEKNAGKGYTLERIKAIRTKVKTLLENLDLLIEFMEPPLTYRTQSKREIDENNKISCKELEEYLKRHQLHLTVDEQLFELWKKYRNKEMRWYQTRWTTDRYSDVWKKGLEVNLQLMECFYRRLPVYGESFQLYKGDIHFGGHVPTLLLAMENRWIKQVIVETYPQNLSHIKDLELTERQWWQALTRKLVRPGTPVTPEAAEPFPSDVKIKDKLGLPAEIKFVAFMPVSSPYFDTENNKPIERIQYAPITETPLYSALIQNFDDGFFKKLWSQNRVGQDSVCLLI